MATVPARIGLSLVVLAGIAVAWAFAGVCPCESDPATLHRRRQARITGRLSHLDLRGGESLAPIQIRLRPAAAPPPEVRKARPEDQFHHIYINPESYDAFRKTGKFPDPTMLVLEIFRAETRDAKGILSGGQVEGQRVGLSVAVKDAGRPGGGVPWAYYSFEVRGNDKPVKPASVHDDKDCYACHLQHASDDNVWVQFYPTLRDPE